jgi:intein-encoded DNA endonuclease-like protein
MNTDNELLKNLDKLHTTELGVIRIKRNLSLNTDNVVDWCKTKINSFNAIIVRNGKNWYVSVDNCVITVNAHSYTIITAHKQKK